MPNWMNMSTDWMRSLMTMPRMLIHVITMMKKHPRATLAQRLSASESRCRKRSRYTAAISATLASTMIADTARPHPPIHPIHGPKALVPQVKVVPQSGVSRESSR